MRSRIRSGSALKWKAGSRSALNWCGSATLVRPHEKCARNCLLWPGKHNWRHLVWEKEWKQPNYFFMWHLLIVLLVVIWQSGCSTDYTHTHSFISSWRLIITGSVFSYTAQKQDWKIRGTQWRHMGTGTPLFHATKARLGQLTHNWTHCAHFQEPVNTGTQVIIIFYKFAKGSHKDPFHTPSNLFSVYVEHMGYVR